MAYNPYDCFNPLAQCDPYPGITAYNRYLGCLQLEGAGASASCMFTQCPALPCGRTCSAPCPAGQSIQDCLHHAVATPGNSESDCVTAYLGPHSHTDATGAPVPGAAAPNDANGYLAAIVRSVPVPGCTGSCFNSTTSDTFADAPAAAAGCCGVTVDHTNRLAPYHLYVSQEKAAAAVTADKDVGAQTAPLLTYQNFLNALAYCVVHTCFCPSTLNKDKVQKICSGSGVCQEDPDPNVPRTSPAKWTCACAPGYQGIACGLDTHPPSLKICPVSWNDAEGKLLPCGGASHGTCDGISCQCGPLWTGDGCGERKCPSVHGKLCSGNGMCSFLGSCECYAGYSGPGCNCNADGSHCQTLDGAENVIPGSAGQGQSTSTVETDIPSDTANTKFWTIVVAGVAFVVMATAFAIYAMDAPGASDTKKRPADSARSRRWEKTGARS